MFSVHRTIGSLGALTSAYFAKPYIVTAVGVTAKVGLAVAILGGGYKLASAFYTNESTALEDFLQNRGWDLDSAMTCTDRARQIVPIAILAISTLPLIYVSSGLFYT